MSLPDNIGYSRSKNGNAKRVSGRALMRGYPPLTGSNHFETTAQSYQVGGRRQRLSTRFLGRREQDFLRRRQPAVDRGG